MSQRYKPPYTLIQAILKFEVRNALAAYEAMEGWTAISREDLLTAHRLFMTALVDDAGRFRSGGVGIYRGIAWYCQGQASAFLVNRSPLKAI